MSKPLLFVCACLCLCSVIAFVPQANAQQQQQQQQRPLVPPSATLGEAARRAIDAPWLTEQERSELRVFHGVWDEGDLTTPTLRAMVALNAWQLDDEVFADPTLAAELRAEALARKGELREMLAMLAMLEGVNSPHAARLRVEAMETLGVHDAAADAASGTIARLMNQRTDDAVELTEAVRAIMVRSRVLGQPARDFQSMMDLLARAHQQLDRLYWPARFAEAELLYEKHDISEAVKVLHETLDLHPRNADVWYMLGRIAVTTFDFAGANRAAGHLRQLNEAHPLADLLIAEARLTQDDPEATLEVIDPLIERLPQLREAYALRAAAKAILYDDAALAAALARYDELSPGSARAHYIVGKQLSFNRQYEAAADVLEEAIRRQPRWPAPQIELGLMELQSGRDANARHALQQVAELDPFNKRAANSLFLLEELADYKRIETEHFIVRYRPGVDEVMVRMMPPQLEAIHRRVTERFAFEPDRKTVIELMPDHQRFAVRITGLPFIHTIAACTGPVIAMEVPREGRRGQHSGLYDWPRVLQHEYTHTVTLAQTRNRIPHWLTEAAAVEMELSPRDYNTARMLARSFEEGTLFDLDEIKWAFVRPRQPNDRSKAYAQGHWMLEYMNERFGDSAVMRLFERYSAGEREQEAMVSALGVSREAFYEDFLLWAERQVRLWGLAETPTVRELMEQHRRTDPELIEATRQARQRHLQRIADAMAEQIGSIGEGDGIKASDWPPLRLPRVDITDELLSQWLERHPDHADLVELKVRRRLAEGEANEALIALLEQYAKLRPVDPFPHEQLARLHLASNQPQRAVPHLEELDAREEKSPVFAVRLAHLYRAAGDLDRALQKVTRALHIDPYRASHHELAAAIAVSARQIDVAEMHIEALTLLEPDQPQHQRRLEAVRRLR